MRIHPSLLLPAVLCLMPVAFANAQASPDKVAQKPAEPAISDEKAERVWKQSWREVARYYIAWKGEYYAFPEYSKDYPSSTVIASHRVTEKMYVAEPALAVLTQAYKDDNGVDRKRTLKKDADEVAVAVKALPKVAIGAYGWIHSGKVARIEGDDTVILRRVELVNASELDATKKKTYDKLFGQDVADYRAKVLANNTRPRQRGQGHNLIAAYADMQRDAYRWWFAERNQAANRQEEAEFSDMEWTVVGFKTGKIAKDTRWPSGDKGVQLAILDVGDRTVLAAPAAFLEKGMTEEDMLGLIKACKLSKVDFARLAKEAKIRDAKGWVGLVIYALEHEGKLPKDPKPAEAAKKPASKGNDVELVR